MERASGDLQAFSRHGAMTAEAGDHHHAWPTVGTVIPSPESTMHAFPVSRPLRHTFIATAVAALGAALPARAAQEDEVRLAFEQFVSAQNAHDVKALGAVVATAPQFLWITRGSVVWGRDAALQRFAKLYEGTWRLDPELTGLRIVRLADDVAQLHVPVVFTTGEDGQPPARSRLFINQIYVKADGMWRVASIFPVPAPAAAPAP
jgi:uncharacterized protein (TIGR02246 family)